MANFSLVPFSTLLNLDGKTTGATLIDTTCAGLTFAPLFIQFEAMTIVSASAFPSISVGTNASSYNNILSATSLSSLSSVNKVLQVSPTSPGSSIPAATSLFANVTVGATATTYTVRVSVIGIYY